MNTGKTNDEMKSEARSFALLYHANDKYGVHDYIYHLDQVLAMTIELGLPFEEQLAALLHDLIEDHKIARELIAEKFGIIVAALVWAVTGIGNNRRERKADTIRKLHEYHRAIKLKMIDRYCNLSNAIETQNRKLVVMYLNEMPDYMELFMHEPELWARMQLLIQQGKDYLNGTV